MKILLKMKNRKMKTTYKELTRDLGEAIKKQRTVYNRKLNGYKVQIIQNHDKFTTYVDGDKLDTYDTKAHAQKMLMQFIRELD
jgi:hypothetical protein